jgi:diphthamide biosynthesis protein 2
MALGVVPAWSGRYILDFEQVIAEVQDSATHGKGETTEGADEPHFSLITGKLVTSRHYGDTIEEDAIEENGDGVIVPRSSNTTVGRLIDSAAGEPLLDAPFKTRLNFLLSGEFLQTRSWQGLEQRIGRDEPSVLEQGRDGIAKSYRSVDH